MGNNKKSRESDSRVMIVMLMVVCSSGLEPPIMSLLSSLIVFSVTANYLLEMWESRNAADE